MQVAEWRESRLGFDDSGNPVVLELTDRKARMSQEVPEKVSKTFPTLNVRALQPRNNGNSGNTGMCKNRKWKILEAIRLNQPTTLKVIYNEANNGSRYAWFSIYRLIQGYWIQRRENDIFKKTNSRYVYELGPQAHNFLNRWNINSFLYPENPYDYGENGERK